MADENVETVRAIFARWAMGDFGWSEWAAPEIQFVMADGLNHGSWRGVPEMARAWREVLRAWEDFRVDVEDCRPIGRDRVLVLTRNTGRGKGSGVEIAPLSTNGANVFTLRGGKVVRLVAYWDRARAFEDLGLGS